MPRLGLPEPGASCGSGVYSQIPGIQATNINKSGSAQNVTPFCGLT